MGTTAPRAHRSAVHCLRLDQEEERVVYKRGRDINEYCTYKSGIGKLDLSSSFLGGALLHVFPLLITLRRFVGKLTNTYLGHYHGLGGGGATYRRGNFQSSLVWF